MALRLWVRIRAVREPMLVERSLALGAEAINPFNTPVQAVTRGQPQHLHRCQDAPHPVHPLVLPSYPLACLRRVRVELAGQAVRADWTQVLVAPAGKPGAAPLASAQINSPWGRVGVRYPHPRALGISS